MRPQITIRARTSGALAFFAVAVAGILAFSGHLRADAVGPGTRGKIPAAARTLLAGRIAYSTRQGDIWTMDADGARRTRLTRSGTGTDFDPSWSPDGRRIVFRTSRGTYERDAGGVGAEGIFVADVRTKKQIEIHPLRGGLFPAWSPDGREIALTTPRGCCADEIVIVRPDGSGLRRLGTPGQGAECATWSPDAQTIAFCGHEGDGNWAVWTIRADGSGAQQLTRPKLVEPAGTGGDYPGAWSPDGSKIVFSSGQFGGRDLFVVDAHGSNRRRVLRFRGADGAVAWLPSGWIVFAHFEGDAPLPRWFVVRPDGSRLQALPWLAGAGDPLDWLPRRKP